MCTHSAYDPGRPVSRTGQNCGSLGRLLILMCLALALPTLPAHAICPLADSPTPVSLPTTASDGVGGSYVVWANYYSDSYHIFALRVDSSGQLASGWPAEGLQVTTQTLQPPGAPYDKSGYDDYNVCVDSMGRLVIVWVSGTSISAQRINSAGTLDWGTDGISVFSTALTPQRYPVIAADEDGGCFIAAVIATDIYVQRIAGTGPPLPWGTGGVVACNAIGNQGQPSIAYVGKSNSVGYAVIAWTDDRSYGDPNIFGQLVDWNGVVTWNGTAGTVVSPAANCQNNPIVCRGNNPLEAYVVWSDGREGAPYDPDYPCYTGAIYAQRLHADGSLAWGTGLLVRHDASDGTTQVPIAAVPAPDGVTFIWDNFHGGYDSILAERFLASGGNEGNWAVGGTLIAGPNDTFGSHSVVGDGAGGFAMSWRDGLNPGVYAIRFSPNGDAAWSPYPTMSQDALGIRTSVALLTGGGLLVAWAHDTNTAGNGNIYEQATSSDGTLRGLQLLSTNGNQSWPPGSTQTVQWTGSCPGNPVTVQLFVDGAPSGGSMQGVSTTLTTNATGGSYSFIVPDVATTRARVQISQVQNGTTKYAYSVNPFTMATLPGSITWNYSYIDDVNHGWNQSDMCANGSGGVYAAYFDSLGGSDLRFASKPGSAYPWSYGVAKSSGYVGYRPSIVSTSNGIAHIAYSGYGRLYYISGNPANSLPSSWKPEWVSDIGVVQGDCSIALDNHNNPYIAFNTGTAGGQKLRVYSRANNGNWTSLGTWDSDDIQGPDHITLKYAGNGAYNNPVFWVAFTDQQSSRLNLWCYNNLEELHWVKLSVTNYVPGPYTDVSLTLDSSNAPYLAYTVPSNGGQNLIFHPPLATPVTVDPTLGTISGVSLQYGLAPNNYPRIGYVGNGVVKQATAGPSGWTRQVVDATGNMDAQVSLVVQPNDDRYYLYRNLTFNTMSSAGPYDGTGGGGGPPHHEYAGTITIPNGVTEHERLVVSGGLSSTPIRFQFVGATSPRPASIHIYDVQGRLVRALAGGDGDVVWDMRNRTGSHVVPGVYFYRAVNGSSTYQGKAVVSR